VSTFSGMTVNFTGMAVNFVAEYAPRYRAKT